jgi:hypothetical protein
MQVNELGLEEAWVAGQLLKHLRIGNLSATHQLSAWMVTLSLASNPLTT